MNDAAQHDTVLDTGAEKLGDTYATALIGAAKAAGVTDRVIEQLNALVGDALANNRSLREAFASPRISEEDKARVIDRLFGQKFEPVLVKFLKVMARRGRLGYVHAVAASAEKLHDDMMGRVVAMVKTAVPIDDQTRTLIQDKLGTRLGREVRLRESVDPALVGGMVIRIGDKVFDSSVSNRLNQMTRRVQAGFASRLLQSFDQFTRSDTN